MTQFQNDLTNELPDEELTGRLSVAVDGMSGRSASEASIQRVIERASQLQVSSPHRETSGSESDKFPARWSSTSPGVFKRVATWATIAATVAFLVSVGWLLFGDRPAFAQVQKALAKVRTVQFAFRSADATEQTTGRVFVIEKDWSREERPDGRVVVTDLRQHQVMELDTKAKTGEIYPLYTTGERRQEMSELISILRDVAGNSVKNLGRRKGDGQELIDYRIVRDRSRTILTVIVDAATNLPVRIEQVSAYDAQAKIIATDFVFDQPIDESLVRIQSPDGYQVTQVKPAAQSNDENLLISSEGLGPVKWGMKSGEVTRLLGPPDGTKPYEAPIIARNIDGKEVTIGAKNGEELVYDSRGFRIIVSTRIGVESINCYGDQQLGDRARAFAGRTDKGIRLGAKSQDVIKVYGEPDSRVGLEDEFVKGRLQYLQQGLIFDVFDARLSHIQVLSPQMRPNAQSL